jgi:Na+-driven multidrug efflux pump
VFDKRFYKSFLSLSVPIALQQLIKALMYFIDNIMIGSLGEDAIVGVGDANQIAFFILVVMFGICSAGWVFAARFYGEGNKREIKKTLGL